MTQHLERIISTRENLAELFQQYPDHKQRYEFALNFIKGKLVADVGCGAGYGAYLMADTAQKVIGFDTSPDALEHAREHFGLKNTEFLPVDKLNDYRFDVIVSFEVIEHMNEADGDTFLQNLKTALKKRGVLIISTPINKTRKRHNTTPYHLREYSDEEFPQKLESNGFKILAMYGQGSSYHTKLYGRAGGRINLFNLIQLGIHRFLPWKLREYLRKLVLGNPNKNLTITKEDWQNKAVQIAVCQLKDL